MGGRASSRSAPSPLGDAGTARRPWAILARMSDHPVKLHVGPPPAEFSLGEGRRFLFLTRDPELIRKQLSGELDLTMRDVGPDDLLDDINTDVMTPAWVCFRHRPEDLARDAYAGLVVGEERVVETDALIHGNFDVVIAGLRKGVGSSRETAVQAEKWAGIRLSVAASFAPIHARNLINQGVLLGTYDMVRRLQAGESISLEEFLEGHDPITREIIRAGGLFAFGRAVREGAVEVPPQDTPERPMTMGEKIIASHLVGEVSPFVKPGDAVVARVDGGYSHEYTTAQVHVFLQDEFGEDYAIPDPSKFAVFEDHLIYADERRQDAGRTVDKIETSSRACSASFNGTLACGISTARRMASRPGICHELAREQFVDFPGGVRAGDRLPYLHGWLQQRPDLWRVGSHRVFCQSGALRLHPGARFPRVDSLRTRPASSQPGVTAKDLMLHILLQYAKPQNDPQTGDGVYGGPGRSRPCRWTSAPPSPTWRPSARRARPSVEADEETFAWIAEAPSRGRRRGAARQGGQPRPGRRLRRRRPPIDLVGDRPMVADPGRSGPRHARPIRPTAPSVDRCWADVDDRHRLRRQLHSRQDRRSRSSTTGWWRRRSRPACAWPRGSRS